MVTSHNPPQKKSKHTHTQFHWNTQLLQGQIPTDHQGNYSYNVVKTMPCLPSPSHHHAYHHVYRWYGYHSLGGKNHTVLTIIVYHHHCYHV